MFLDLHYSYFLNVSDPHYPDPGSSLLPGGYPLQDSSGSLTEDDGETLVLKPISGGYLFYWFMNIFGSKT